MIQTAESLTSIKNTMLGYIDSLIFENPKGNTHLYSQLSRFQRNIHC